MSPFSIIRKACSKLSLFKDITSKEYKTSVQHRERLLARIAAKQNRKNKTTAMAKTEQQKEQKKDKE